jgi:hypothetical protein
MSDNIPRTGAFTRSMNFAATSDPTQPRFFMDPVQDEAATAREGRPIFRERELVQLLIPGSPNQPTFEVNDEYRKRWPTQYEQFKKGLEPALNGTPLEQWPILNRSMVLELKALQIFTVEQLAALSDVHLQQIKMAGRRLRDLAQAYLDDSKHEALLTEVTRRNEELETRLAEQDAKIASQDELLQRLSSQLLAMRDAPHPLATYVPGNDGNQPRAIEPVVAQSALDNLPAPRRRGKEAA